MPILKLLFVTLAAAVLTVASAQAEPSEVVAAAIETLGSSDYAFSYDIWPGIDSSRP